jgi:hypothetical protein
VLGPGEKVSVLRPLRRSAAALALGGVTVVGLPVAPAQPGPSAVHDTAIAVGGDGAAKREGWSTIVEVPDGTESVAVAWDGEPTGAVELRSHGAAGWSGWVDLHADDSHDPDGELAVPRRSVAGPVFVGDADRVEIVVEHGSLAGLTLHALAIDDPPAPSGSAFGAQPAAAAIGQPGILGRSSWGAAPWAAGENGCEAEPSTARVRFAVLHHTVTTNNYAAEQTADQIRSVQYVHQELQGYCDIAYNFVVDRFGRTWEGRSGGIDRGVIGGHAKGFNTGSVGVVLLGQHHTSASPPAASVTAGARAAVVSLLRWKFALHGVDARARVPVTSRCDTSTGPCRYAAGTTVSLPTIVGHRDVQLTACPGDLAQPITSAIRGEVADAVNASGPFYPLPGWLPETDVPAVLTLDRWGGVHPAGSAQAVPQPAFWPLSSLARGIGGDAAGGWMVDAWGGLHEYGSAPARASRLYWPGADIARAVVADTTTGSGYVLDAWGGLHPFGVAPSVVSTGYWPGRDLARDITLLPGGLGGWKVDAWGGLHTFGLAPQVSSAGWWPGWDIARAIAASPDGVGGWVLDAYGGLHPFGGAGSLTNPGYRGADAFRDLVMVSATGGYAIDRDGVPWPVGDALWVTPQLTSFGAGLGRGVVATPT